MSLWSWVLGNTGDDRAYELVLFVSQERYEKDVFVVTLR